MRVSPVVMRALWPVMGLLLGSSGPAAAQEPPPAPTASVEAGVETDTGRRYLFRGLVYGDGPVTQSTAWISAGGWYLYGWTNVAVVAGPGARTLDEVDVGASYAIERGALTVEPGLDIYLYRLSDAERADEVEAGTAEVSLAMSYAVGPATLSTRQVLDAGSYRARHFRELGLAHQRTLTPGTASRSAGASAGRPRSSTGSTSGRSRRAWAWRAWPCR
ncbi:MAG: hypothetical protein R2712_08645 [Vicinamibacterales bacterium]